jgi:hypothetical protein
MTLQQEAEVFCSMNIEKCMVFYCFGSRGVPDTLLSVHWHPSAHPGKLMA